MKYSILNYNNFLLTLNTFIFITVIIPKLKILRCYLQMSKQNLIDSNIQFQISDTIKLLLIFHFPFWYNMKQQKFSSIIIKLICMELTLIISKINKVSPSGGNWLESRCKSMTKFINNRTFLLMYCVLVKRIDLGRWTLTVH